MSAFITTSRMMQILLLLCGAGMLWYFLIRPDAQPLGKTPAPGGLQPGEMALSLELGNEVTMEFVFIPAGEFKMGSRDSARDVARSFGTGSRRLRDEHPRHRIWITQDFYMSRYEVTQAQWQAVMDTNPSRFKDDKSPVETISWADATAFCQKLSQQTNKILRLPTEAEWEYACRAGTMTPFHFGETISTEQVNYDGGFVYGTGKKGVYRQKPAPVGSFPANAWGLHDMHGNVWEWCLDWHGKDYYNRSPLDDPTGMPDGTLRVLRGGSWDSSPGGCRSAHRCGSNPDDRHCYFGFRVVVDTASKMPVSALESTDPETVAGSR